MAEPRKVILLDTNAYLRLARSIVPLLGPPVGENPGYTLFVLREVDEEHIASFRLRSKFEWVYADEHRSDRLSKRYECKGKTVKSVALVESFLSGYARSQGILVSRADIRALAVGRDRGFIVVSDDSGMAEVAEAFQISLWSVLDLLKLLVDVGRIPLEKVNETLQYLEHENDLPMGRARLRERYKALFGSESPV